MDFVAIDFETANAKWNTPCALGVAIVKNDMVVDCSSYMINPEVAFSRNNTRIHGITADDVRDSPLFPEVIDKVIPLFRHYPIVAHNVAFDRGVLEKTADRYDIELPPFTYYCTLQLYKYNYPDMGGFKLNELCDAFDIELCNHHCCHDDSLAAAGIMIRLLKDEDSSIFSYRPNYELGNYYTEPKPRIPAFNPLRFQEPDYDEARVVYDQVTDISFHGTNFVITGDFEGFRRSELEQHIADLGGHCASAVSGKTDYLIVGMQNKNLITDKLNNKSSKIIKAEALREQGSGIRIISDEFFIDALLKILNARGLSKVF